MNKKYWYKIDFSKASKSLAKAVSKHFHVWEELLANAQLIKYITKTDKEQTISFSSPKKITNPAINLTAKLNFGNFTAIFKGKKLNKDFKKLKSLEISNKKLGKVSYTFNKVASGDLNYIINPDKNNIVIGSKYADKYLEGDGGDNIIDGGAGNDKIYISGGKNIVYGGLGNDVLQVLNSNSHKLYGGKGKDIFKLSKGKGYDLIQDFKDKEDKIYIGSTKKLKLKNKGKDVLIYIGKDLLAKVKGAKGDLSKKGKYLV